MPRRQILRLTVQIRLVVDELQAVERAVNEYSRTAENLRRVITDSLDREG
jgi:hypothetical protein